MDHTVCETCQNKTCLKKGKPCKKISEYLRKQGIYSADWIRPRVSKEKHRKDKRGKWREVPFTSFDDTDKNPYTA